MSLVAMKVWIRGRFANRRARAALSMSSAVVRQRLATVAPEISAEIALIAS